MATKYPSSLQAFHTCLRHRALVLLMLNLTAILAGCSKPSSWEATHPVTGTVTFRGKPVSDVELSFFPTDPNAPDTVRPKAKSTEDGKFIAWTYTRGDGVPAGSYKVTAVHHAIGVSRDTLVAKPNDLPAKYSKLETTDLQFEIKEGHNEIPPISF